MSEKLKPCPFCGGEAYDFGDGFTCCKDECPSWMLDGIAPIELWNTRPGEDATRREAFEECIMIADTTPLLAPAGAHDARMRAAITANIRARLAELDEEKPMTANEACPQFLWGYPMPGYFVVIDDPVAYTDQYPEAAKTLVRYKLHQATQAECDRLNNEEEKP